MANPSFTLKKRTRPDLPASCLPVLFLCAQLIAAPPALAADALLKQAEMELSGGNAQLAYDTLLAEQSERAGEPDYDALLAAAAIQAGQPDMALFALERLQAVQPDHPSVHLLTAQALLQLGERENAVAEFQTASSSKQISAEQTTDFKQQLAAYDRQQRWRDTSLSGYLQLDLGYDDNVTSVTDETLIPTPTGAIQLNNDITGQDSAFGRFKAGVSVTHRLQNQLELVAAANAFARYNEDLDGSDLSAVDARVGLRWKQDKTSFTGSLYGQKFYRDHDNLRDSFGPMFQVRHSIDRNNTLLGFVRITKLDYQRAQTGDRDSTRYMGGATWLHTYQAKYSPVMYINGFIGTNDTDTSGNDHFSYDVAGIGLGGQFSLTPKLKPFVSLVYSYKEFDANNLTFLRTREDDRVSLRLGAQYVPAENWTIRPEVSYTNNDSNIILSDYDRTMWTLSIRRNFN